MNPAALNEEILKVCPAFEEAWKDEGNLWGADDETYTFHGLFSVLSHHVADLLEKGGTHRLAEVFVWVERHLTGEDEMLSNAAETCFLENLMNRVPALFAFESFRPMLGPASEAICEAYGRS